MLIAKLSLIGDKKKVADRYYVSFKFKLSNVINLRGMA